MVRRGDRAPSPGRPRPDTARLLHRALPSAAYMEVGYVEAEYVEVGYVEVEYVEVEYVEVGSLASWSRECR